MGKIDIWQIIPFLLPVISFFIGKAKGRLKVPKPIRDLLGNQEVMEIIILGIEAANGMKGKSNDEKREYVRSWAKSEIYKLLGEWLSDSAINFLIETAMVFLRP